MKPDEIMRRLVDAGLFKRTEEGSEFVAARPPRTGELNWYVWAMMKLFRSRSVRISPSAIHETYFKIQVRPHD